jgi:hypothetical protein
VSDQSVTSSALSAFFGLRIVQITAVLAAAIAIYSEGATAYLNTQKAIEAKATADNAMLLKKSEGELAEQKASSELEVARNAAVRQRAEADKAEAEVDKAEADATTARSTARNAELKASADANTIKAEAELRRQKVIVALETARNAARRQQAETDKLQAELGSKKQANATLRHYLDVSDCSKPYQSTNYFRDLSDIMNRRQHCGK